MPLTLITGIDSARLKERGLDLLLSAARQGTDATWALPDTATVRRESAFLAKQLSLGVKVTTLDRLLSGLWAVYGDGRRLVGDVSREALVGECMQEHDGARLSALRHSDYLRRTVASLAARTLDPGKISATTPVEREVRAVIQAYFCKLEQTGQVESAQASIMLPQRASYKGELVVGAFSNLSPSQVEFIRGVSQTGHVTVLLKWEQGFPATSALDDIVHTLDSLCDSREHVAGREPSTELELLSSGLWHTGEPVRPTGQVILSESVGEEAEAVQIARLVGEAIDEGRSPGDIAITGNSLSSHLVPLLEALEARAIPVAVDVASPLGQTPMGKAFLSLFAIVSGRGGRAEALAFLNSPYVAADPEKIRRVDLQWRSSRNTSVWDITSTINRLGEGPRSAIQTATKAHALPLGRPWAEKWEEVATKLLAAGIAGDKRPGFAAQLDAATHSSIVAAIGEAADAGASLSALAFFDALADMKIPTGSRDGENAVQLLEMQRLRTRNYPMVVVVGMSAEQSDVGPETSLALRLAKGLGLEGGSDPVLAQNMLFYSVLSNATQTVVLSRTIENLEGIPLRSSVYWDEVTASYVAPGEAFDSRKPPEGLPVRRISLARISDAAPIFDVRRLGARRAVFFGEACIAKASRGVLSEVIRDELSRRDEFSVTELETYLSCPYRWFIDRVVSPNEADVEFGARERGTLVHTTLEKFYRRVMSELPEGRVVPGNTDIALRMLKEVSLEGQEGPLGASEDVEEYLGMLSLGEGLKKMVMRDAGFPRELKPAYLEWKFGSERPVEVGGVRLVGKIDRIDQTSTHIAVFDYKTGKVHGVRKLAQHNLIQAPIYGAIASRLLGKPLALSAYSPTDGTISRGFQVKDTLGGHCLVSKKEDLVESDELADMLQPFENMVIAAAGGIRAGDITPKPSSSCAYCAARTFCEVAKR